MCVNSLMMLAGASSICEVSYGATNSIETDFGGFGYRINGARYEKEAN